MKSDYPLSEAFDLLVKFYEGDRKKAMTWLQTPNPLLGHQTPRDMVMMGHSKKVLEFVKSAIGENEKP